MSETQPVTAPPIVVMGVQGTGKSTVGAALADALGVGFVDGDDLHPDANRAKMAAGHPLTDADRAPWLERIGKLLAERRAEGTTVVVACSALKRGYRDALRAHAPDTWFLHLTGDPATIAGRLATREHAYMPPALLASQLQALEPLGPDEAGLTVSIDDSPVTIVRHARAALAERSGGASG